MNQPYLVEDQRKFSRQPSSLSCQLGSAFTTQSAVDISRGGSRIYSNQFWQVGARLKLEFFVPENDKVTSYVKVAWIKEAHTDAPAQYEVGLQFLEISEASLKVLLNLTENSIPHQEKARFHRLRIREVVQQALSTGFLSIEAENRLRKLLKTKYDSEDLCAFFTLQQATSEGYVSQESRIKQGSEAEMKIVEV